MQSTPYPGYARGPYATRDRCPGCSRLIGHGALAVKVYERWWHRNCRVRHLARRAEAEAGKRYWYPRKTASRRSSTG